MPSLVVENRSLYLILLVVLGCLAFLSSGPGLTGSASVWHYHFFDSVCHQLPERSYSVNGVQMAVCSRCFGIYTSLFSGWLLMPLFVLLGLKKRKVLIRIFSIALGMNLIDILGNNFELWTNTLTSRMLMGILFGLSITILLGSDFFKQKRTGIYGSK